MKLQAKVIAAASAVALAVLAMPVSAAGAIYDFDATAVGAFGPGSYGTVSLTQAGSNVSFAVALRADLNFVTTGNANSKAVFAFNAMGVSASDILNIADASGQSFRVITPGQDSPFGTFSFGIVCSAGCSNGGSAGGYADPLTFTVANAVLTDFALLSTKGSPRAYFAADVYQVSSGSTGAIGATSGGITAAVPEPETYALMFAGLGAIGLLNQRRKRVRSTPASPTSDCS
jgi:PEP-CTERM motif